MSEKSFHYGGQAVIEGVMMRGKNHFAVACRRASGEITTTTESIEGSILGRLKWLNRPLLRGTLALIDSILLGMKSLMWSANIAMEDEEASRAAKRAKRAPADAAPVEGAARDPDPPKGKRASDITLNATMFLAFALALVIFMFVPIRLTKLTIGSLTESRVWLGLTEGGIKLAFLLAYVWGISQWKDIRRVFEYHGAEHKVINAHEAGEELTTENVQRHTTVHVRCGTSFLLAVILVSIIVFAAIPWSFSASPWKAALLRFAYKLPLLPVVAGIAYEIIKLGGGRKDSRLMRFILGPGLLVQRITTQEPSDDQVEVAIRSFQSVREAEEAA